MSLEWKISQTCTNINSCCFTQILYSASIAAFAALLPPYMGAQSIPHVSFVLLAEFHVNEGSILPYQYPFPTGTDDQ